MKTHTITLRFLVPALLILLAAFSRILPHPPNFTPVGAMALFGAAWFKPRHWAFIVPFAGLWLSDLFLNNVVYAQYYPRFTWFDTGLIGVYLSFGLIGAMGLLWLRKVTGGRVVGAALAASVLFFVVTNFGVWATGGMYAPNWQGLLACYSAAIPFFGNTLLGDLCYTTALFASFGLLRNRFPALAG